MSESTRPHLRVNLLLDTPADVRADWLNIDPTAQPGDKERIACDLGRLDALVDAGEVGELVAMDILGFAPRPLMEKMLSHWISKLAHGGSLTVSVLDLLEVTKSLQNRLITVEQASELLYGSQDKPWRFRQSGLTLGALSAILQAKGLKVQKKRMSGFQAIVVAVRP